MNILAKFFAFLRSTSLWIILISPAFYIAGAASNQLVLIANHDKFPVMLNESLRAYHNPDGNGMLDKEHCVMTDKTHLNFLGDIIDRGDGHMSFGDLGIELGSWLWVFAPYLWGFDVTRKLRNYGR